MSEELLDTKTFLVVKRKLRDEERIDRVRTVISEKWVYVDLHHRCMSDVRSTTLWGDNEMGMRSAKALAAAVGGRVVRVEFREVEGGC